MIIPLSRWTKNPEHLLTFGFYPQWEKLQSALIPRSNDSAVVRSDADACESSRPDLKSLLLPHGDFRIHRVSPRLNGRGTWTVARAVATHSTQFPPHHRHFRTLQKATTTTVTGLCAAYCCFLFCGAFVSSSVTHQKNQTEKKIKLILWQWERSQPFTLSRSHAAFTHSFCSKSSIRELRCWDRDVTFGQSQAAPLVPAFGLPADLLTCCSLETFSTQTLLMSAF